MGTSRRSQGCLDRIPALLPEVRQLGALLEDMFVCSYHCRCLSATQPADLLRGGQTRTLARPQAAGGDEWHDLFVGFLERVKGAYFMAVLDFANALNDFSGTLVFCNQVPFC